MLKTNSEQKTKGFFEVHPGLVGLVTLLGFTVFPRLTMFFIYRGSVRPWGLLLWLFVPRFLIAILATQYYRQTDPVLVALAWIIAIAIPISGKQYFGIPWNLPPPI